MLPDLQIRKDKVAEIKLALWEGSLSQTVIAAKFDISQATISRIYRGVSWRWLPWPDGTQGGFPQTRLDILQGKDPPDYVKTIAEEIAKSLEDNKD